MYYLLLINFHLDGRLTKYSIYNIGCLVIISLLFSNSRQIDINNASYDMIMGISFNDINKKELIAEFMQTHGQISTIYDLLMIPDLTTFDISQLKTDIYIGSGNDGNMHMRLEENSYNYSNYLDEDGSMSNASQYWLDMIINPEDINQMNYFDLINLPILSPMDVSAVLKKKKYFDIENYFSLKNTNGISRYGLKNLGKFITFPDKVYSSDRISTRIHVDINTRPRTSGSDAEAVEFENENPSLPEIYTTIRSNFGKHLITGISYFKSMGEPEFQYSSNNPVSSFLYNRELKGYVSIEKIKLGNTILDRLVIGNFSASYGQGIVFTNTDHFRPRRTGYGWSKRQTGITPDGSRSTQFVLNGIGAQFSNPLINISGFASYAPRDAIINSDSSFASLITLYPRLEWGLSGDHTRFNHSLTNSVNEVTYGGHIDIFPSNSLRLGTTYYESLYDRVLHAEEEYILATIIDADDKFLAPGYADAEISAMYSSSGQSILWDKAKSYRRVIGMDFTYILDNITFQGEYGELSSTMDIYKLGDEPSAWVINTYFNFDKLDLLLLYRNYDLDFDNAYQRSFSNYQRYKNTLFQNDYRLNDPIYSYLHLTSAQPQSEKGFYIYSRYEFHRNFLTTLDWDTWTRVADKARYYRIRCSLKYSPVFDYSFKISQKFQVKAPFNIFSEKKYYISETTLTTKLNLSNYNNLTLTYLINRYHGAPRPSLATHLDGYQYSMQVGDAGSPEISFGVTFTHHFDTKSTLRGSIYMIDGYFLNTASGDFRIFSDAEVLYSNIAADVWISNTLKLCFKFSRTSNTVLTNVTGIYAEGANTSSDATINFPTINKSSTDFTLQVDYVF